MEEIAKFHSSFDLKSIVSISTIESLDFFEKYLDFSIHTTIRKQMPEISNEQEKYWAGVLLVNYLNGDTKAFTSSYGIRKNIAMCGQNTIFQMLLKQAIERSACMQSVFNKLIVDSELEFVCNDLTMKLAYCKYDQSIDLARNNLEYRKNLIENYVKFKYRSSIKNEISRIRNKIQTASFALNNLECAMQSTSMTQSEERKRK